MLTHNQEQFVYWIMERDAIRQRKADGKPAPWTDNPVLQSCYFCNVDREDDKVTRWIRDNWHYSVAPEVYDFAMVFARLFNLPATLAEVGQPEGDLADWLWVAEDILEERQSRGEPLWNGAYIVSTNGKKMPKLRYCMSLLETLAKQPKVTDNCTTLGEAHKALMKVEGLASFLAAQVVADLKNSAGHPLVNAPDWWTFSAFGPGSLRGLSWFWEREVRPKGYQQAIQEAYEIVEYELPESILEILCMQNLQNCFCEYDKFMRVTNGTGRSKRKYQGVKQ